MKQIINVSNAGVYSKTIYFFSKAQMANITIDGKDYDTDNLSDEAKQQLASLQFAQAEIKRLNGKLAIYQTAASAYSVALKEALDK